MTDDQVEVVLAVDDAGNPLRTAVWVGAADVPELDEFRSELCR